MSRRKSFDLYIVIMFATWKITYSLNVVFKIKFLTITRDVSNCTNNTQRLPATSYKIETKPHVHWKTSFMFTIGMPSHEYLSVFFINVICFISTHPTPWSHCIVQSILQYILWQQMSLSSEKQQQHFTWQLPCHDLVIRGTWCPGSKGTR